MLEDRIAFDEMEQKAEEAAGFLKIMAHPVRLLILCRLIKNIDMNVGEIVANSGLSQSATSQHLSIMRESNLIATQRKGNEIYYSISDERVIQLISTIYGLFCANEGKNND